MLIFVLLLCVCGVSAGGNDESDFYHSYYGYILTDDELKEMVDANTTFWCAVKVTPCDPNEGRRQDGTCNNLQYPSRGGGHTPFVRELPSDFEYADEPKKAVSGKDLPLPRRLRTEALAEGRVSNRQFTRLVTYLGVFLTGDIVSLHDTINFLRWKTYCCQEEGKTDHMCTPIIVPDDDPVHRFSEVRCLNLTRPLTFQSVGCIDERKIPDPKRISSATVFLDMSSMYGQINGMSAWRQKKSGLLKVEEENNKVWPPSFGSGPSPCLGNKLPSEIRCHATPEPGINTVLGANLFAVWFWRYHNFFASRLGKINPCWSDERIFEAAKDINIAVYTQILYYELLPLLLGQFNMYRDGVISFDSDFRDTYDENLSPALALEFSYVWRYMHTLEEGLVKMFDKNGNYLRKIPVVNMTLRTGYLGLDDHMDEITQGAFRQPCAKIDKVVDPYISELGLGPIQRSVDLTSNDLYKGRLYGFPSYIHYRQLCSGYQVNDFDDLYDVMEIESIDKLKDVYEDVEDVDLLLGIWLERPVPGGYLPSTLACILTKQLIRSTASDRHWYERQDRPNAFTYEQLQEIRQATVARMLCDVGDSVKYIQPQAFLRAGTFNSMQSCKKIPKININAWKDPKCNS